MTAARDRTVVDRAVALPAHLDCRIGARARTGQRDAWPAVVSIALGMFALVFSELIPVGLLAGISGHLQAAEAHRQLESGTVHERIILTLT